MPGTITAIDGSPCLFATIAETYTARLNGAWTEPEKVQLRWTATRRSDGTVKDVGTGVEARILLPDDWAESPCTIAVVSAAPPANASLVDVPVIRFKGARFASIKGQAITTSTKDLKDKKGKVYKRWSASYPGQSAFRVGSEMPTHAPAGIAGIDDAGAIYVPSAWEPRLGPWAWLIWPTVMAETQAHFDWINTYDIAHFTFGLGQMSLRNQGTAFVTLLRELLQRPEAIEYFPDQMFDAGLVKPRSGVPVVTNAATEHAYLIATFNPKANAVEAEEVIGAARLIAWSRARPELCELQLRQLIAFLHDKLKFIEPAKLEGRSDEEILIVADILHQGRSTKKLIEEQLDKYPIGHASAGLLGLGDQKKEYIRGRIATVQRCLDLLHFHYRLIRYRWDATTHKLVPVSPAAPPATPLSPALLKALLDVHGIDRPGTRPYADSGITLGFGYRLADVRADVFRRDWAALGSAVLDRLETAIGLRGDAARTAAAGFADIVITEAQARDVFVLVQGPGLLSRAEREWGGFIALADNPKAALLSLWLDIDMQLRDAAFGSGERRPLRQLRKGLDAGTARPDLGKHFDALGRWGNADRRRRERTAFIA